MLDGGDKMYLQCTKKMLDRMAKQNIELVPVDLCDDGADGFYSWHINYITINRRKAIVCMNNLTRYPIVLYRPKPKDIAQLEKTIKEAIRTAFRQEGVQEDVIEEYLCNCGNAMYSKTAGSSLVAYLNKICERINYYPEIFDEKPTIQSRLSFALSKEISKYDKEYKMPSEKLLQELCRMKGLPEKEWRQLIQMDYYQLLVRMVLEGHNIWCRIQIPSVFSFKQLHDVIQIVFDWFDCHLHEFLVPDGNYEIKGLDEFEIFELPIKTRIVDSNNFDFGDLDLVDYKEVYDYGIRISEVFEHTNRCYYIYDFGDCWIHEIIWEKTIHNCHDIHPILLDKEGSRPPENVGGEGGYEEYLRVISDPQSPDYEFMIKWSEITKADDETVEEINRRLKYFY